MATETTSSSVKFSTPSLPSSSSSLSVLMVGAGEYNCGYVLTKQGAAADKPAGVTALVLYDLKRRFGYIQRILLADVSGSRVSGARQTMENKIGKVYKNMNTTIECYPDANVEFDGNAYLTAMDTMKAGDAVIIFTPDPTHFSIAKAAIERHLHVLVAKPLVKTLQDHLALESLAKEKQVLLVTEYHKRFDPMYSDARARIQKLGWFSFYSSIMTQRKDQLDTFAGWAGKASDISYYLNSHHIDIHCWSMEGKGRPTKVVANASYGVANDRLQKDGIEDTITLLVTWDNYPTTSSSIISSTENSNGTVNTAAIVTGGHAIYTASWIAPYADCHTQQSFHYMGQKGEIRVDQAHRGYSFSADTGDAGGTGGLATLNPLYMRYTPDNLGYFAGQHGYGYRSIEAFIYTCRSIQDN
jgi:D-galacturonate reductase